VTVDKNGGLSGTVTVAGKKATFKAVGYDAYDPGDALYDNLVLDLGGVCGKVELSLTVSEEDLVGANDAASAVDAVIEAWCSEARFWIDDSVDPDTTCLEVTSDAGVFPAAQFGWTTKTVAGGKRITGVGKTVNGSKLTFKVEDKTGVFSGAYGTYKIYGSMEKGTCTGVGTLVDKGGAVVGLVRVGVADGE